MSDTSIINFLQNYFDWNQEESEIHVDIYNKVRNSDILTIESKSDNGNNKNYIRDIKVIAREQSLTRFYFSIKLKKDISGKIKKAESADEQFQIKEEILNEYENKALDIVKKTFPNYFIDGYDARGFFGVVEFKMVKSKKDLNGENMLKQKYAPHPVTPYGFND